MLKKAGIITAGVAATLVAVSPLAFAGEKGHGHHEQAGNGPKNVAVLGDDGASSANGLVAVNALNNADVLKNVNVCPNVNVGAAVSGILGLLSGPATTPAGDQTAVCSAGDSAAVWQK
ncbi:hypothetical protein GCM10009836_57900 [Pseudonocardia ailaonensis]|uniref:Secreted protein n=1 Tax=Pseudonocardia ailaonensis TaxID=367279 RepID=A0ABN2NJL8_9PSEU